VGVIGKRSAERQRLGTAADHNDIHLLIRHKDLGSFVQTGDAADNVHAHTIVF
jgi:hypothetical protein